MTSQPLFQLQIGALSKVNQPAFIPYNGLQTIVLKHAQTTQVLAHELAEALLLQLLQKQHDAQVLLYEASPSPQFAQLKRLFAQSEGYYGAQLLNSRELGQHTTNLTELAHRRFALLANSHHETLFAYNAHSRRPEKIVYLLISDINALMNESNLLQILQPLCLQAPQVGIVPVLLFSPFSESVSEANEFKRKALNQFWQAVQNQSFGFDLSQTPISGLQQPSELWRLFSKFALQIGIDLNQRQQSTNTLLDRLKTAAADNPDTDFLRIQIGTEVHNAKPAYFCLGEASNVYHGMIGGATRSGKSTLLNNLIINLCETYSPEQLRLWLFDYKQGVEFNIFKELPHLDALHVDTKNPHYALNAFAAFLQQIDQRRALFERCEPPAARLVEYNQAANKPLSRCVMVIDEVQILFKDYDSKKAVRPLLESIALQGAAYGLHIILCTQSYQDVDLAASVKEQFHLRLALQLSSSSACRALMGRDNDAPLNLPRYHAVYNAHFGEAEHNRILALDGLTRQELWQRIKALKARYPHAKSRFDFSGDEKTASESKKTASDDFANWNDLM